MADEKKAETTAFKNGGGDEARRAPSTDERTLAEEDSPESISVTERDAPKEGNKPKKLSTPEEASAEGRLALRTANSRGAEIGEARADGKIILHERDVYDELGYSFSTAKKWWILFVVFLIQMSMNFNSSVIANALPGVEEEFGVGPYAARNLQGLFLICYAFGCELWAAPSEEFGRWRILQLSMLLENCWMLMCALAPNFGTLVVGRVLGGFSLAGGSVTLGMVADLYEPEVQGYAVAWVVLSSVGGTTVGPIVGGFQGQFLGWRWNFWLQLIFLGFTQILHWFTPETKASVLAARIAKRKRDAGEGPYYAPEELKKDRWSMKEILTIMYRPFYMFFTEPIVLFLSLLSGFSDALIFTFLEGFQPVYAKWNFSTYQVGLAFVPIALGYILAYLSFLPFVRSNIKALEKDPNTPPERRLWWLLYLAPLEAIGLFGFAWTSLGPPRTHWIAPMIFSCLVGIANYAIYMATIDYMINSYGAYAASATGGNGFARDFLAGVAAYYSAPMFSNIGNSYHEEWASTILAILAALVCIPVYWIYMKGPQIRAASPFAVSLDEGRKIERTTSRTVSRKQEMKEKSNVAQRT